MVHCVFAITIQLIWENNIAAQIFCLAFDINIQDEYVFAIIANMHSQLTDAAVKKSAIENKKH